MILGSKMNILAKITVDLGDSNSPPYCYGALNALGVHQLYLFLNERSMGQCCVFAAPHDSTFPEKEWPSSFRLKLDASIEFDVNGFMKSLKILAQINGNLEEVEIIPYEERLLANELCALGDGPIDSIYKTVQLIELTSIIEGKIGGWIDVPLEKEFLSDLYGGYAVSNEIKIDKLLICISNCMVSEFMLNGKHSAHAGINDNSCFGVELDWSLIPKKFHGTKQTFRILACSKAEIYSIDNMCFDVDLPPTFSDQEIVMEYSNHLYGDQYWRTAQSEIERQQQKQINKQYVGSVKAICFYLPQFHRAEINDQLWGNGFTEWNNVARAFPLFKGHEQPRIPADLGFYDLADPEIHLKQIKLAKEYGIHGFCYYYYDFDGKSILDVPLKRLLTDSRFQSDPYCLCWANENWTKKWDGSDDEIILKQSYSESALSKFLENISPWLLQNNYIRIDGKPLLLVYNFKLIPNVEEVVQSWREQAVTFGFELFISAVVHTPGEEPERYGFDASIDFPPHAFECNNITSQIVLPLNYHPGSVYDWNSMVNNVLGKAQVEDNYYGKQRFPAVCMGWVNTARRGPEGHVYHGANATKFREWISFLIKHNLSKIPLDRQFLFINAWNEWAEGTYLEPDSKNGFAYLNAFHEALIENDR